jgi:hypothetical protein
MTPEAIRERLSSLREMDFAGAEKLADEITKEARGPLWTFGRVLEWEGNTNWHKVEFIVRQLDELAILPWLSASLKLKGGPRIQAITEAARLYEELHKKVLEKLRAMLKSQTTIPAPEVPGAVEMKVPDTRECDEAYVLLRHLHLPDEIASEDRKYRLMFSRLSEEERDRIIHRYVETGEFQ